MKKLNYDRKLIEEYRKTLGGVFSSVDLETLLNEPNHNQFYRRVKALESEGTIRRFIRGFYTTESFNPEVLTQKIAPQSYISCTTTLSKELIIGIRPQGLIEAVGTRRTRVHIREDLTLKIYAVKETIQTGIFVENGVSKATPERAFLDCLYLYQHGNTFLFDIYSDINTSMLRREKVLEYLEHFKNPKFRKFAMEVFDAAS